MEGQVVAGDSAGFIQYAGYPAQGIGLHLLTAHLTQQLVLVEFFQADLADRVGATVAHGLNFLALPFIDSAHIADHMGEQLPLGVEALESRRGLCAQQPVAVNRECRALLFAEVKTQCGLLEWTALLQALAEAFDIPFRDGNDFAEIRQQLLQVGAAFRHYGEVVTGAVIGNQLAVAIIDQAAGGGYGSNQYPVVVGLGGKVLVAGDLQVKVTDNKNRGQYQCSHSGDQQATGEHQSFACRIGKSCDIPHS